MWTERSRRPFRTSLKPGKNLKFNVFFKGDDWRGTPKGVRLEQAFAAVGVEVVYFPYTVHTSSSALRLALETLNSPLTGEDSHKQSIDV